MALKFSETEIQFIINELEKENQLNQIDIADHQGEFFLVPDFSVPVYIVDTLPSPSVEYVDKCYIPRNNTVLDTLVFAGKTLYQCVLNKGTDSAEKPYIWESVLDITSGNVPNYVIISEIDDIPGI